MLRDYQLEAVNALRDLLSTRRSACLQLATGAGKTPIVSEITRTAYSRDFRVWFVVPRNELLQQASDHFQRWGVTHGFIAAGKEESRAFRVHVVSKDTLLQRLDRIKNWPDLIVFDEAHLYYDAQIRIIAAIPERTKIIGVTATPERLDGRGLADIYEGVHYGPSIPWLTDRGFLSPLRYFAPPIAGLEGIHRRGTEYDADELDALLEKRKVYGDVIRYYEKYGTVLQRSYSTPGEPTQVTNQSYHRGKPALIFCRSVRSAYETAERFTQAGFLFFCIEGAMRKGERARLIQALRRGEIDGLTNCDLATYGLDIPRVEYGASIRPTLSRALYFQMVGRILRPFEGKEEALFFDHANLVEEHTHPLNPGIPLFYLPELTWNFDGLERRERKPPVEAGLRLCPLKDYQYCDDPACARGCKRDPAAASQREGLITVDVQLEDRTPPRTWTELAPAEKRDVQDRIGTATDAWLLALSEDPPRIDPGPVGALLKIAEELGRAPMWVFWHLTEREGPRRTVNVTLLHEIARQKGYKPGWVWWKRKQIEEGAQEKELVG